MTTIQLSSDIKGEFAGPFTQPLLNSANEPITAIITPNGDVKVTTLPAIDGKDSIKLYRYPITPFSLKVSDTVTQTYTTITSTERDLSGTKPLMYYTNKKNLIVLTF